MSKIEVDAVEPQSGTTLTLGASGDTITIPAGATISNSGTAAGFGPTGAVSWNTTKITADPNPAVSGVGYFADTTSAAFTITLPSTPSAGAVVGIADYANTFATNNLTIGRNGSNIGGVAANSILATNGLSVTFVYVDATQGWIVTDSGNRSDLPTPQYIVASGGTVSCCGDYKIHTFTGPGTFTVCSVGNPAGSTTVDYLVVAGGGGGGTGSVGDPFGGGGGGAGGFRTSATTYCGPPLASPTALPVSVQGYPITVGGGGGGSSFSTITSAAGGVGASGCGTNGAAGGSGGGPKQAPGSGAGNTPPVAPPQGNPSGPGLAPQNRGTGGGGAGAAGSSVNGGAGEPNSITGSSLIYAGGGGGGGSSSNPSGGTGGSSIGGNGGNFQNSGANGTTNRGGGGGGIGSDAGAPTGKSAGSGASGIVIIRYKFQ